MWLDPFPMSSSGSSWRCCFCLRAAVHRETITPVKRFISSVNQTLTSLKCSWAKNAIKDIICLHGFSAIQVTEGVWAEGKRTSLEDTSSGLPLRFVNSGGVRGSFLGWLVRLTLTQVTVKTLDYGDGRQHPWLPPIQPDMKLNTRNQPFRIEEVC